MVKAVYFDAIDTLFRPYPDKVSMYARIIEKHTGIVVPKDQMSETWDIALHDAEIAAEKEACAGKISNQAWTDFNQKILVSLGYQGDLKEKGDALHFEAWGNPDNFRLYDDVIPSLKQLKEKGVVIGCVSNEDGYLKDFFRDFGIESYFDFLITSEEFGCEKPNPGIFEEALRIGGVQAEDTIFVGDSIVSDYNGSKRLGFRSVLIDRENKIKDDNIVKISTLNDLKELLND